MHPNVAAGSILVTDGWKAYTTVAAGRYGHVMHSISSSGHPAHELLPHVHLVASLLKRWLLATHQGAVDPRYLQAYLDEFVFRFNRRNSTHRGLVFHRLLEACVVTPPQPLPAIKRPPTPAMIRRMEQRARELEEMWFASEAYGAAMTPTGPDDPF